MSVTDRQNRLLVAEDWKKVYQSYRNVDFQGYDFDNLRRAMINYLRQNNAEDFNDYIESSEYIALIDLIAYMGQNLSFRIDLNARENFLELAERRESILRLARLINYHPKRNIAASGLLKLSSVRTTESFVDSNNINLSNQDIVWNDPSNTNWYEQFIKVLNKALPANNVFGTPTKKSIVEGIETHQYKLQNINEGLSIFSFNKVVNGQTVRFEIVSADFDESIVEESPKPGNKFAILYKNDNRGPSSSNTGFFAKFVQGTLDSAEFTINNPSTTQVVSIDAVNINNDDIWLYKLNSTNQVDELWSKVPAVVGNNIIYNSLSKNIKNIYSVLTRANDRVSLIFSDGVFGNLPKGTFRVYYRTSKNASLVIAPVDFIGITISFEYISSSQKIETMTINFELVDTVDNAAQSETNLSIKQNAPAAYYTQNRLVTAEDYQIGPLNISQEIIKAKSVNRVASGISRYLDLLDVTGKYSKTSLFGTDGILYKEIYTYKTKFRYLTQTDIEGTIYNVIEPILSSTNVSNFYNSEYPIVPYVDLNLKWKSFSEGVNFCTGYIENANGQPQAVNFYTTTILKLIKIGSSVKWTAPAGFYFDKDNKLVQGTANVKGSKEYIWVSVTGLVNSGVTLNADGSGPIIFNDVIPTGSVLSEIRTPLAKVMSDDVRNQLIDQVYANRTFGLRFDRDSAEWKIIIDTNLNVSNNFSIGKAGDITNQKLDSSWILKFTNDGEVYTIETRAVRYLFESDVEIRFYFDKSDKTYDNKTGKIIKDKISVLSSNLKPGSTVNNFTNDINWSITDEYRDPYGYINSKKVEVSFFDSDDDGIFDDPDIFERIIKPINEELDINEKYIFLKRVRTIDGIDDFVYQSNDILQIKVFETKNSLGSLSQYNDGQIFYYEIEDFFETYTKSTNLLSVATDYKAFIGRDKLKFYYEHSADESNRIDPSITSIIDTYVLTKSYDTLFRQYLNGSITSLPKPPSSDSLQLQYKGKLDKIKTLTDEIIFHPAKYRVLFGDKADISLQASFKVVKNPTIVLNDNDVKSRIISAINDFFILDNWDFGETFYFTELVTYVVQKLAPDIATFILVPKSASQTFGSLYEINAEVDEIFINGATVQDVDIIDVITASTLQATGKVVTNTSYSTTTTGLVS